ncbi:calcium-binding protein [Thalassococcus lentus]|uniref:Calcium-binding protein n=1 Tax=Thalassococcus lentus TaxID=1210524 RepID=A0ABT4XUY4_9RHOB|nr:calcium-binding protein [Thalassococcus lentus]MDA7425785.1 calcium-binding protein [Thalassococcus lentus]
MFFLAGLLGMMVLGSVAVVSTADPEPEDDSMDRTGEASGTGLQAGDDMTATGSLFEQLRLVDQVEEDSTGRIEEGGSGDDLLNGTDQTDLLGGADGDDTLSGGGDDDELVGGAGADNLSGDAGADTLHGEGDWDTISGGSGDDALFGHSGSDLMQGGDGNDSLQGGLGDDALHGDAGDDALLGREGADTLDGGLGQDTLFGGWGDDMLNGVERGPDGTDADGMDFLNGADGADTIAIGTADVVSGGDGADTMVLGHWITGDAAELVDFDSAEDQIMIVYDDSTNDEPELDIRLSADDPNISEIVLDGHVVSTLPTADAPGLDAVVLVGESTAQALSLG